MSKNESFVIERLLKAPVQKVWKAITNRDQMKEWYFDLAEFKPVVGFEFSFEGGKDGKTYLHLCRITEVVPGEKLSYTWRYDGYEGESHVAFELFPEGENTRLKLTHAGLDTFPADNPDFAKHNFEEGWNYIIGTSIKEFVETEIINKSVEINSPVQQVWNTLVDLSFTNQWAQAFGEGTQAETDWKKGSEIVWNDKEGNVGARGIIKVNRPPVDLIVQYYDDIQAKPGDDLGEYVESYHIDGDERSATLTIAAGPLALKYIAQHEPLWNSALQKIKELAEKTT